MTAECDVSLLCITSNIACSEEEIDLALNDSLATFDVLENFVLKQKQQDAVRQLSRNKDVLAVLPTGFGKSIIFRFSVRVKQLLTKKHRCMVVVFPLKSIVDDQVVEA